MKTYIILLSVLSATFMLMHEFDAFHRREWNMFKFMRKWTERLRYLVFLYVHIPLLLLTFYYIWTVINFSNFYFWLVWNVVMIAHLAIHLIALGWKSNVFKSIHSFIFIAGAAVCGILSLLMANYY